MEEYEDKRHRAEYLSLQVKLIEKLKYLSIDLKNFPLKDRSPILHKKLT